MCSHYQALKKQEHLRKFFDAESPPAPGNADVWPGYLGTFIRRHPHADAGDAAVPVLEALNGLFGLVPHWASDTKITRHTYNARSETVAEKPSFQDAFIRQQRCIVPMDAFYEPDWRSGKAVATRIASIYGEPLGVAGLWSSWKSPPGNWVHSFTLLTINADAHPLMQQFHKPTDEKRMLVILPPQRYQDWLQPNVDAQDFLLPYPPERLQALAPEAAQGMLI
jgi:putative SOS response-associated peptidase YedK